MSMTKTNSVDSIVFCGYSVFPYSSGNFYIYTTERRIFLTGIEIIIKYYKIKFCSLHPCVFGDKQQRFYGLSFNFY